MNRRAFLGAVGLLTTPLASPAWGQSASRIYRIGYLGSGPLRAPIDPLLEAFLGQLQELGYAEGRNLILERRTAEGRNDRYRALADELVTLKVDLIIAPGTAAALGPRRRRPPCPSSRSWLAIPSALA